MDASEARAEHVDHAIPKEEKSWLEPGNMDQCLDRNSPVL